MSVNVDVLIIGAGAAGMMCAIEAARRGRSVL
ncbi:MAG: NAD(P)/FAD-dependent oxidoreductase, partial [Candidatus Nitrotoga sp.]